MDVFNHAKKNRIIKITYSIRNYTKKAHCAVIRPAQWAVIVVQSVQIVQLPVKERVTALQAQKTPLS
jgi:hypothetical protein